MNCSTMPLESATALAPEFYSREDIYQFELKTILANHWQVIGAEEHVENPGDVIVREIGGIPVTIVRSKTGDLNGFLNICPHRAGPIATCDQRGLKRLRCAYHGWSYDFEGNLKVAPEMHDAENFDRDAIQLTRIEVEAWNGLVLARLDAGVSIGDQFAGIEEISGPTAFENLKHHTSLTYEVAANWKVYVDNFLEGYHLPFVHPGLTQLVDYSDYTTELSNWWSLQRSPVEESGPYGAGEGLYFFVYPNTMLNIMPGRLQTNRVVPKGLDRCLVEFDFYYAPGAESRAAEDLKFSDIVQEEDRTICESVQTALLSGRYNPGRLSPSREAGVWHYQNILRDTYRDANL